MRINADNTKLQYTGRIDRSDPKEPLFIYPCTSVRIRFTGNMLTAYVPVYRKYAHSIREK